MAKKKTGTKKTGTKKTGTKKGSAVGVKLYKGQPTVELLDDDTLEVRIKLNKALTKSVVAKAKKAPISISLDSLDIDVHNQSFGMVQASTGCVSNPGGPSC